jgi:hypothetical protein
MVTAQNWLFDYLKIVDQPYTQKDSPILSLKKQESPNIR